MQYSPEDQSLIMAGFSKQAANWTAEGEKLEE
jgi:hypothetical protein